MMYLKTYIIAYVKIQKNKDILSVMSNLQPNCCLKIDFLKVGQHAGYHMTITEMISHSNLSDLFGIMNAWLWNRYDIFAAHITVQWCHNEPDGVSNHRRLNCLLNRLFGRRSRKTSKLRDTGLNEGNSPVTGEFPTQRASNAENVSMWWYHHAELIRPQKETLFIGKSIMWANHNIHPSQVTLLHINRAYFWTCVISGLNNGGMACYKTPWVIRYHLVPR